MTVLRQKQEQEFHLQLAREIQQRYYTTTASLPGFDIAAAAYPADTTGGDYFDFLPQPDGSLYIILADIAGHGFGSAFMMAETRAALRAYATMTPDLSSLLGCLNRSTHRNGRWSTSVRDMNRLICCAIPVMSEPCLAAPCRPWDFFLPRSSVLMLFRSSTET
jgi:hypothetical protein